MINIRLGHFIYNNLVLYYYTNIFVGMIYRFLLKALKPALLLFIVSVSSFSQQSSNMRLLANLNQHSADGQYSACWGYSSGGREYAILGCALGTSFVDITDTNNITEVGYIAGPNEVSCCREMKTYSHYCYIIADGISSGLQIIDLQYLPDSVQLVNTFYFTGFTRGHTIQVENPNKPYLYLSAGDYNIGGLFILDLSSDPVHPVKRGEWEQYVVHDCRVVNDTIFACNIYYPPGTISVISATNKDNLSTITSWANNPQPGPHNIAISGDRNFAYVTDEISGNPRLLKIWNISNLSNVIKVAEWQPTGITTSIIHNVELFGYYLFAAHYTAGLRVVNISNPYTPTEAAWYDTYPLNNGFTYDGCWGTYIFPSEKFIASDRATGLYVFKANFSLTTPPAVIPSAFSLRQNYPNPFNPVTTIVIGLPEDSHVTLKVYDVLGQEVKTLRDEFMPKGTIPVNFDGTAFASGIYYCKMVAGDFTSSIKLVLLK
jgi:choice-of-anchor B domain-containing protein